MTETKTTRCTQHISQHLHTVNCCNAGRSLQRTHCFSSRSTVLLQWAVGL